MWILVSDEDGFGETLISISFSTSLKVEGIQKDDPNQLEVFPLM